ncbi:hypothetical protein HU200_014656 [Digitaria exilis]|uniref:KIB1-4 beta-propeller domain-containing protein n=1 Tax=Digitaria exilis TaxID=1010633 RepID=A0A835FBG7_9POAL|nr:hypothetical protein HU200_014656 [Digitaria exilis]
MSWADLPPDLLRLISGNLHEVGDLIRFLSVCQAWRDTAPPAPLPQFLPWLLAPRGKYSPSIARFRSVFSNTTTTTTTTWCAPGTYSRRTMWLSTEDGTAMWSLTSEAGPSQSPLRVVDPFTGAATALPPFAREIAGYKLYYTDGFVLADGTFVLYGVEDLDRMGCAVTAAMLRPGDTAWMEGGALLIVYPGFCGGSAATYHDGEIVLVDVLHVDTVKLRITRGGGNIGDVLDVTANTTSREDPPWSRSPGPQPRRTYTFKSRGELLVACLLVQDMAEQDGGVDQPRALAGAMSVSVFALEEPEEVAGDGVDIIRRWVKRDGRSLGDRVLFLGCPTSFAVDAARFGGAISGGCAYLVLSSQQNAGWSRRNVPETCRVYRYSFEDGSATVVEELPTGAGWDDDANMTWVVPRPSAIAPVRVSSCCCH